MTIIYIYSVKFKKGGVMTRKINGCIFYFFLVLLVLSMFGLKGNAMEIGKIYHGFKLVKVDTIPEMNGTGYLFEHIKSGAHLLKVVTKDDNKLFSIGFKTLPNSDGGTPHILEHSVLNGSDKYPIKEPFNVLLKGSLHTFLNAFTAKDRTMYPVASRNTKDFFNLMDVYLDAVFHPLVRKEKKIFMQEGWHYELDAPDKPLTYKGVVYNEMKGAFSSPETWISYYIYKNLLPNTPYNYVSGGFPDSIVTLKYEDFLAFYNKYYHPSNSYIFLYGDGNTDKELEYIDKNYLSAYTKENFDFTIPVEKPFDKIKKVQGYYSISEGDKTEGKTYISFSFVTGMAKDRNLSLALSAITDLLVNLPGAPLKENLMKAGIGKDVSASLDELKQNVFSITVQNANEGDTQKFEEIFYQTLQDVVKNGFDKKKIEGVINRMEFSLKEGPQSGTRAVWDAYNALTGWMFADDPFLTLKFEKPLKNLKRALKENYLENIVKKYLLENKHAVLLTLSPKPGLEAEHVKKVEKQLEDYKKSLSKEEIEKLVQQTKELKEYQLKPNSKEDLEKVPMLAIEDINPKAEKLELVEKKIKDFKVLYFPTFTNHIIYQRLIFDVSNVPQHLIQYTELLCDVLGDLSTEKYSYSDLSTEININTGGISFSHSVYTDVKEDDKFYPKVIVYSKVFPEKYIKMNELIGDIIKTSKFDDTQRLKEVLYMLDSRLKSMVYGNGNSVASTRLVSYLSNSGMFNELTSGLSYYEFIEDLVKNFDNKKDDIVNNLKKVANLVFNKSNMTIGVICSDDDYSIVEKNITKIVPYLNDNAFKPVSYKFEYGPKNEGILAASKVQYVYQGYNFKKLGYDFSGKMDVLRQILSRDYLYEKLRVLGGAYGGFAIVSNTGYLIFGSYRDPNLKETLENYKKSVDYLKNFTADKKEMTRYIIGTIASIDRPLVPSQKGDQAITNYFRHLTYEDIQKERTEILNTTADDIKSFAKLVEDVLKKNVYCVYGNEVKINENKDLFDTIVKIK